MRLVLLGDAQSPHLLKWARALAPQVELWAASSRGFLPGFDSLVAPDRRLALDTRPVSAGGNVALLRHLPRLAAWLHQVRPDWIHAHYLTSHGALAWLACSVLQAPGRLVGSAWGSDILLTPARGAPWRWLTRQVLQACALTTSDSQHMAERMQALGAGEVMVFPFGLELLPRAPLPGGKQPHLFFANRGLEPLYAPQRVLQAFAEIAAQWPQAELVVANDGSLRAALQKQVGQAGLAQRVRFVGLLDGASQDACYQRARWYLSLPSSDSVAVSVLEAMAHGCIPLLSDLPANRELVRSGDNGLLLPAGALPSLADLSALAGRADAIASANHAWVASQAMFAPAVAGFLARLRALGPGMNILYINHYAGSPALGMEFRPYHLAREWVRAGHRVQVMGATYSHVRARQPAAGNAQVDGIAYRWLATPRYQGNGPGRVANIACFLSQLWAQAGRLVRDFRPDVVIASSTYPMDFWVARRIARRAGALLVHEVHDLWPLSPIELSGMSPRHPFIRLCQAAEDAACRDADRVVSILPKVHAHLAAHGLDLARLTIVPNGITPADWQGEPPPLRADLADTLARLRAAGRTVVGYAGSMGLPNALDVLLDAAARLRDAPLSFVIVGDGHERQRLVQRLADEGLSQVVWLPPVPKAQVPALLAAIDIAYLGWQWLPIYRFGIAPNKLMDYMAAGCPVLHSVDAGNDPVAETGCGLSVPPESPQAVAAGLLQLAALPASERARLGRLGRDHVMAHHAWPVLAERFLQGLAR